MSPKTQTQPSAATAPTTDAAAASASIASAPPFLAPWRVINSPEPAGFWKAVGVRPLVGDWVMQLGANPHPSNAPYTAGELIAGFQWSGYLPTGLHTFIVRFANGPITANANGGQISANLFLQVDGRGPSPVAAQRNGVQYLVVSRFLFAGNHTVSFGGILKSAYQGLANPYGEMICARSEFTHFSGPYEFASIQAAATPAGLSKADLGGSLFDEKKLETVEIDARKEAQARLIAEPILTR
ncbi:MAG: hypothetical protein QOH06_4952 [Acidobacteriota bacterium]|jgi:hypothetical protein|nr:hypothetical protein [Acidobacteriota bacterium]